MEPNNKQIKLDKGMEKVPILKILTNIKHIGILNIPIITAFKI